VAAKLSAALSPDGVLISAHARTAVDEPDGRGFDWDVPFGSRTIVDTLAATPGLRLERVLESDLYRIVRLRKTTAPVKDVPAVVPERVAFGEITPALASHVIRRARGTVQQTPPSQTARLSILMYHRVAASGAARTAPYRVTPSMLDEQLAYLREAGFRSVTLGEWLGAIRNKRPLPGRAVALTFDDGYEDFAAEAWPLLHRYGFTATVFVVAGHVGAWNAWDAIFGERLRLMDWEALRDLAARGVAIGSHSVTHRPLTSLSTPDLFDELQSSRQLIEDRLDRAVTTFAYPYGDFDGAVQDAARRAGYAAAVTCRPAHSAVSDRPWTLPRFEVSPDDTLQQFVLKL
jgi:peptidoglycan/xylan/chitin deacetylase (PgdA/CDA1 family)